MIDFDEVALKLAKAEADNEVLRVELRDVANILQKAEMYYRQHLLADKDITPVNWYAVATNINICVSQAIDRIAFISKGGKDE